jgi:hypothetical protein
MDRTITSRTTHEAIRSMLREDGYGETVVERAAEIKDAAGRGALLWTRTRLTTTDSSRIDARPIYDHAGLDAAERRSHERGGDPS